MAEMLEPDTLDGTDVRDTWDVAGEHAEDETESRAPVEEDRKGYELIDGTWVEKPAMGLAASIVTNLLQHALTGHVLLKKLGSVAGAEGGYQLFASQPKSIRKPDVSFVAQGRMPNKVPTGYGKFVPDFAAEVVSPNDECEPLEQKIDEYLRAGVKLVWVVYPNTQVVYVFRPDGTAARKTRTDSLDGESVFPGLVLPVADLFIEC